MVWAIAPSWLGTLSLMLKKVAFASYRSSTSRISKVSLLGPSSMVSATTFGPVLGKSTAYIAPGLTRAASVKSQRG